MKSIGEGGDFRKILGLGRKTKDSFSCGHWESMVLRDYTLSWWFLLVQELRISGAYHHFPIHHHGFLCRLKVISWRVTFQITKCENPSTNANTQKQIYAHTYTHTYTHVYSQYYDESMICTRHLVLWEHWQWKLLKMRTEIWLWNVVRNSHLGNRGRKWYN